MPDQRFLYTEEAVGANHPTKADTINRLVLVEHNNDGTHKKPAFSVHKNGTNQTGVISGSNTKVTWSTEEFDTNNNFANDAFTPTVSGKYLLTARVFWLASVDLADLELHICKNGSIYKTQSVQSAGSAGKSVSVDAIVYANGTTDYFEVYAYQQTGANQTINGSSATTAFQGCRID